MRSDVGLAAVGAAFHYASGRGVGPVDLACRRGEILGVLGPNGAGKSTLVRLLSGILTPYEGSIELLGRELSDLSRREIARRVAVVPQEPPADLPYTALEIALLGRHPHLSGIGFEGEEDVDHARWALQRVGASELADRPIGELSAGERQRVFVAKALAQQCPVLLLDEPTSALDLRAQVSLFDLLRELAAEGHVILAVLHDLNLAAEYCDRVSLFSAGKAVVQGETAEALTYAHLTAVYGTEVYVDVNDLTGRLVVTPLSARARQRLAEAPERSGGEARARP